MCVPFLEDVGTGGPLYGDTYVDTAGQTGMCWACDLGACTLEYANSESRGSGALLLPGEDTDGHQQSLGSQSESLSH